MPHVLAVQDDAKVRDALLRALTVPRLRDQLQPDRADRAGRDHPRRSRSGAARSRAPRRGRQEVFRMLRVVSQFPVIVVTARDEEQQLVTALNGGADDYLVKPFGPGQLDARIRAVLRGTGQGVDRLRWPSASLAWTRPREQPTWTTSLTWLRANSTCSATSPSGPASGHPAATPGRRLATHPRRRREDRRRPPLLAPPQTRRKRSAPPLPAHHPRRGHPPLSPHHPTPSRAQERGGGSDGAAERCGGGGGRPGGW